MADEKDDAQGGELSDVELLEKAIKTNRTLFVILLVLTLVIVSILGTAVFTINKQMANRTQVPTEDFAELLQELDTNLQHLNAIHNAEAQVYFDFQDSLQTVRDLYDHEKINNLRMALIEREQDTRVLMDLMSSGMASLSRMHSGSRQWTNDFAKQVADEKDKSNEREETLRQSLKTDAELAEEAKAAEKAAKQAEDKKAAK